MGKHKAPPVKTIGQLMDHLKCGKTPHVSIPRVAGSGSVVQRLRDDRADQPAKTPPELSDFDGLMRRCNRYYGKRLCDPVLLQAIDAVAEHKGCLVHHVRRMTIAQFNAAWDEAKDQRQYGPDPKRQGIIYWDSQSYKMTPKIWRFLLAIWGKDNVPFADIGEEVWENDVTPPGRIRQVVRRVNHQLREHGIDLAFTSEGEQVSPISDWPR